MTFERFSIRHSSNKKSWNDFWKILNWLVKNVFLFREETTHEMGKICFFYIIEIFVFLSSRKVFAYCMHVGLIKTALYLWCVINTFFMYAKVMKMAPKTIWKILNWHNNRKSRNDFWKIIYLTFLKIPKWHHPYKCMIPYSLTSFLVNISSSYWY